MIFISSICLNWDHYGPKFHFRDSISPHSLCFKKKKKKFYPWVIVHIPECSFLCTDLLTCILLRSFHCNLILVFKSSLCYKAWVLVFLCSFPCDCQVLVFLLHHLSLLTPISATGRITFIKQRKIYKIPVPTDYVTGKKSPSPSSTPSIPVSSSCLLVSSSSSASSTLSSFCFPFSLLPCTSINSPLDSSYKICSSSESSPFIPASFSKATAILRMSFLMPLNSLRPSNFLKISVSYSASIYCFAFLVLDLRLGFCLCPVCHDLAKRLSHYLYFFSFLFLFLLIGLTTTRWSAGKSHMTLSQCHNGVTDGHRWSHHSVSHD